MKTTKKIEKSHQEFLKQVNTELIGWYQVSIGYKRNNPVTKKTMRSVLDIKLKANSIADAYEKGCGEIQQRGGFSEVEMESSRIDYFGPTTNDYLDGESIALI